MLKTDLEMPPGKKMMKARSKLVLRDPFFGSVAMGLRLMPLTEGQAAISRIKAMGTDSKFIVYNKFFVAHCTIKKLVGSIAHEAAHVAFKHPLRRGNRNFKLWNVACDYAINSILIEAGYELPDGVKHNSHYDGMSAEQIYTILKRKQDEEKLRLAEALENEIDDDLNGTAGDSDDFDSDGDDFDSDGDDFDPGQQDFSPDEEGAYELPDFDDEFDEMPQLPEEMDDFSAGVVLDAPEEAKTQEAQDEADLEIQSAAIAAKAAGKLPGSLERLIESQHMHKVHYRDLLRDWVQKNVFPANYTWKKPNRRFSASGIMLPSIDSEWDLPNIGVAVDESGSVTDQEEEAYANEMAGILSEFQCSYTAIYFDTSVRRRKEFSVEDLPIKLEVKAGGGTNFQPVFDYIKENSIEMEALLFFTDMGAFDWHNLKNPGYPVLWMNTDRLQDDKKVPFGTVIPLEMDDDD